MQFADRVRAEPGVSEVMHTSTKQNTNISRMLQYIKDKCVPEFRSVGAWLMIGGLPNVGKSTMINALRKRDTTINHTKKSGAKTGAKPCLTKSITDYKIIADPPTYLLDSPGIIQPHLREGTEDALKLSAVQCIREGIVETEFVCDYILFKLNECGRYEYTKRYDCPKTNDIDTMIEATMKRMRMADRQRAFDLVMKDFREGRLGRLTLDTL